jgi:hypothetical protein
VLNNRDAARCQIDRSLGRSRSHSGATMVKKALCTSEVGALRLGRVLNIDVVSVSQRRALI